MDKKRWKIIGAIVIVLIFAVYFSFFYKEDGGDPNNTSAGLSPNKAQTDQKPNA